MPLGVCTKGLPDWLADVPLGKVGELGLSLWAGDLLLPALTLRADRLQHNLARMMRFCGEHRVALAPHGKTTMAPQLSPTSWRRWRGASPRRPSARRR